MSLNGHTHGSSREGYGEECQDSRTKLVLVMCDMKKGAFDFIGEELPRPYSGNVRLRNALVLAYGEKLVLERLDDLHVPKGHDRPGLCGNDRGDPFGLCGVYRHLPRPTRPASWQGCTGTFLPGRYTKGFRDTGISGTLGRHGNADHNKESWNGHN